MIISFGKTAAALQARRKTATRRDWTDSHAEKFNRIFDRREAVDAWNTSPRNTKGNPHRIARIMLTEAPYKELSNRAEEKDGEYEAEGFAFMDECGLQGEVDAILLDWESNPRPLWVVRFEVIQFE